MHNLLQVVEWSNQKFVGLGLQVYGADYAPNNHYFIPGLELNGNWAAFSQIA